MKDIPDKSVDMVLCDLPYTFTGKERVTANSWDLPIDDTQLWSEYSRIITDTGAIVLFATNPFSSYLVMNHLDLFKYEWIWEKDNGSNFVHVKYQPFRVHEQILVFGKAPTTYNTAEYYMTYNPQFTYSTPYSVTRNMLKAENLAGFKGRTDGVNLDGKRYPRSVQKFERERGYHPTQKPVELCRWLIRTYTNEGDVVLDNTMGSGTTGVACKLEDRSFIGIELLEEYFNLAKERIDNTYRSFKLF
jgi:site-specific DNA-methyltransferase (adenine-specific)